MGKQPKRTPSGIAFILCILLLLKTMVSYSQPAHIAVMDSLQLKELPFCRDTIQSFSNQYVEDSIVPSITSSASDIEIRMYAPYYNSLRFYSIQYAAGKVETRSFATQIFHGTPYNFSIAPGYVKMLHTLTKVKGDFAKQNVVCLSGYNPAVYSCSYSDATDSMLRELISNNIFTLPDISVILAGLHNQNTAYNSLPYFENAASVIVEIKLFNQYRNFRAAPGYFRYNKTIEAFHNEEEIVQLIRYIVSDTRKRTCENSIYP